MKKIIIVGATSGLGARVAVDFAAMGWRVGIAGRRQERLDEIKKLNPELIYTKALDVTAPDAVRTFYDFIEELDGMDVLLFSAGTGFKDPDLDSVKLRTTLETNVVGFAEIVAAAYRYYRRTANVRQGQIAAITSVAGIRCLGPAAAYSSSKRFQQMFLDSLEQLSYRQQVNVAFTDIRPGFVRTELLNPDKDYPLLMSVDYVAPRIEAAILHRRRRVIIDTRWRVVVGLWRLIPRFLWKRITLDF